MQSGLRIGTARLQGEKRKYTCVLACKRTFGKFTKFIYCTFVFGCKFIPTHMCGGQRAACRSWLSPSILWLLTTQVVRLGSKYLYLWSYLTDLSVGVLFSFVVFCHGLKPELHTY